LTIRIDEGELPTALRTPLTLAALQHGPPASSPGARSGAVPMSGCRVTLHDERPPLDVRARPSSRAPIVGTLVEGAVVIPERSRSGAWSRCSCWRTRESAGIWTG
jgi:hypothetical protein